MKNALLVGVLAATLFTVSAGLSLLVRSMGAKDDTAVKGDTEKASAKDKKADAAATETPKPVKPSGDPAEAAASLKDQAAAVRDGQARLDKRQAQIEVILADIRSQREELDALNRRVATEAKAAADRAGELDARAAEVERDRATVAKSAADAKKTQTTADADEQKNLVKMAEMYNTMPSDTAARVLQQMADGGRMDTAVKILATMKERQAAKVLAELTDAALAAQLLDKMRAYKRPVAPAAGPGS